MSTVANRLFTLVVLAAVAAVAFAIAPMIARIADKVTLGTHAEISHPTSSVAVRDCPTDNVGVVLKAKSGREMIICEVTPGQWGRMITEEGREVTSFLNSKKSSNLFEKVVRYACRTGFTEIVSYKSPEYADTVRAICH